MKYDNKYRIIEVNQTNRGGESETWYEVEKCVSFLWMKRWVSVRVYDVCGYIGADKNKIVYHFEDVRAASRFMDELYMVDSLGLGFLHPVVCEKHDYFKGRNYEVVHWSKFNSSRKESLDEWLRILEDERKSVEDSKIVSYERKVVE